MNNEILLIPDKADIERDSLAEAWKSRGGEVKCIGKFWVKPDVGNKRVSIYGNDSFGLVLAQILGIRLLMPKDEMIADLPNEFIKRKIAIKQIGEIATCQFPLFIKPVTPKLFKAAVYQNETALRANIQDISAKELIICSTIIAIEKEVRAFILNKTIQDLAFYEGSGKLDEPRQFIEKFLSTTPIDLPKTFVLDIGYNEKDQWFIIEFNASWGAGLNFCKPEKVIDCIQAAVFPIKNKI